MTGAQLTPGMEVAALLRIASNQGGFGAVLRKGDEERGTVAVVFLGREGQHRWLQRRLAASGEYEWSGRDFPDSPSLEQYVARACAADPDLWVVELDVPSTERFIAEMT